ncbi:MAG TPA: dTDP-4-dehydrorhamnose reductase [Anaerolineales bacterium]|nr:dTDP-4-dehydrorhamnose reductase [Anaerolineales bacterium]
MRILLLGNTGQLGWELERCLANLGEVHATDYPAINFVEPGTVRTLIRQFEPQLIVNATAYTAVDRAESESDLAYAINADGPGLLAEEALQLGAALVHYSTDYVFDGTKNAPYTESDPAKPLGVYGQSKLAGEQAIQKIGGNYLVLRTAWVYSTRRDSFVSKVLSWARQQSTLKLVNDQVSNPTWARALAQATALLLAQGGRDLPAYLDGRSGLYHLAGWGYCSRMEWGQEIVRLDPQAQTQTIQQILPAATADFPTPAQRPLFSALDCSLFERTFNLRLPAWQTALRLAMNQ